MTKPDDIVEPLMLRKSELIAMLIKYALPTNDEFYGKAIKYLNDLDEVYISEKEEAVKKARQEGYDDGLFDGQKR